MRHGRIRNILAAGALTGLVLATLLAFAWQRQPTGSQSATVRMEASNTDSVRADNEQLRQAVDALKLREAAYQQQIEAANQTILQLQAQKSGQFVEDEEEDDEWEEHEHEEEHESDEDEYEEHEREHEDD